MILAGGVALPAIGMARLHPYEYVSFNHLAGGVAGAQPRFMLDYWGLAFKQAGAALRAQLAERGETPPAGGKWKIAVCGPHPPAQIALGPQFEPTWEPKGADFALMLGAFYCSRLMPRSSPISFATASASPAPMTSADARSQACSPSRR